MLSSLIVDDLQGVIQTAYAQKLTGLAKLHAQSVCWRIYFIFGRMVWISDRIHSLRRWKRHVIICSPALAQQIESRPDLPSTAWSYTALAKLTKAQQFPENQFSNIIESVVTENLFDILQVTTLQAQQHAEQESHHASRLSYKFISKELTSLPFVVMNYDRAWREAKESWQAWTKADLARIMPDYGLTISDFDKLRVRTSAQTLKTLRACCSGRYAIRDLAIAFRQPTPFFVQSLLPYLSEKMVALTEIPDLVENFSHGFSREVLNDVPTGRISVGAPTQVHSTATNSTAEILASKTTVLETTASESAVSSTSVGEALATTALLQQTSPLQNHSADSSTRKLVSRITPRKQKDSGQSDTLAEENSAPKVVYVDDSSIDSRAMAEVVEKLGYQYRNISDAIQALPLLLEAKPDLIFLDLVMPVANGYEICAQIRRVSTFKKTPVIIVTSNDGVADRVRARLVGASGFLGKPIREKKVAKVLRKHLRFEPADATRQRTQPGGRFQKDNRLQTNHPEAEKSATAEKHILELPTVKQAAPERSIKKEVEA